ncbi:MAG: precorrin-8X methylmutase [Lachnospiraceae bacterium]|nr:precorrin-8X methylmutase [Lachnospiraceae bacterium]
MSDIYKPMEIETESFRIITEEIKAMGRKVPEEYACVIKRVIHTTADFSYLDSLYFSEGCMEIAKTALRGGCKVVTDTNMARAGVHESSLERLGGKAICYMADQEVARIAKERQVTRASVSMEKTAQAGEDYIYAIGNAPTALLRLIELTQEGRLHPRFVIGAPVGFVNVVEAKERLIASGIPCIVPRGRKGGSNVAAAILNALLYEVTER